MRNVKLLPSPSGRPGGLPFPVKNYMRGGILSSIVNESAFFSGFLRSIFPMALDFWAAIP